MNARHISLLSSAFLVSTLQAAEHFWDEIPSSPSTTPPATVLDDYWNSEFLRVNREVSSASHCQLVFFGDSITLAWSAGKAPGLKTWQERYSGYQPINMGNSGDITPVMLYRITNGNLDFAAGGQPKVAVLLCGINNFGVTRSAGGKETWALGADCPPADIAHAQRAIAQVFRRRLPQTRVILMALLPVADGEKWEKCRRVNEINARVTYDADEVVHLNLQDRLLLPDGTLNRALFTDGLHLSEKGYQAWAEGLEPLLGAYMKAPPLAPVKIMLIGGGVTEGADSSASYRRYLDGLLRRQGHLIDLVGSRRKHHGDRTEPDSYQYDLDHEGHWGRNSGWFAENMPRLLKAGAPDVAVIELGAGDVGATPAESGDSTARVVSNIKRVIEALRSANEEVRIVVAGALPSGEEEAPVRRLNRSMEDLARVLSTPRQPVAFCAIDRGLDRTRDLVGGMPTPAGAGKIAATLAGMLHPFLDDAGRK